MSKAIKKTTKKSSSKDVVADLKEDIFKGMDKRACRGSCGLETDENYAHKIVKFLGERLSLYYQIDIDMFKELGIDRKSDDYFAIAYTNSELITYDRAMELLHLFRATEKRLNLDLNGLIYSKLYERELILLSVIESLGIEPAYEEVTYLPKERKEQLTNGPSLESLMYANSGKCKWTLKFYGRLASTDIGLWQYNVFHFGSEKDVDRFLEAFYCFRAHGETEFFHTLPIDGYIGRSPLQISWANGIDSISRDLWINCKPKFTMLSNDSASTNDPKGFRKIGYNYHKNDRFTLSDFERAWLKKFKDAKVGQQKKDLCDFSRDGLIVAERVVRFLEYKKADVAVAAAVDVSTVRYGSDMPEKLRHEILKWAKAINAVAAHLGTADKAKAWFEATNPHLGGMVPRDLIRIGRFRKLQNFIKGSISESKRGA